MAMRSHLVDWVYLHIEGLEFKHAVAARAGDDKVWDGVGTAQGDRWYSLNQQSREGGG